MLPKTVSDPCGVYNELQVLLEQGFFGRMSISPTSLLKYFIIVLPSSGYVLAGL